MIQPRLTRKQERVLNLLLSGVKPSEIETILNLQYSVVRYLMTKIFKAYSVPTLTALLVLHIPPKPIVRLRPAAPEGSSHELV